MARALKPLEVSEFRHHESNILVKIFFDRNEKDFFADILGTVVRAPSEHECHVAAAKYCKKTVTYAWRKIIVVNVAEDWHGRGSGNLHFSFKGYEIAARPDGKLVQIDRAHDARFNDSITTFYGNAETDARKGYYVLPWSQEAQDVLQSIQDRIDELKERLKEFLSQEPDKIAAGFPKMLPSKEENVRHVDDYDKSMNRSGMFHDE